MDVNVYIIEGQSLMVSFEHLGLITKIDVGLFILFNTSPMSENVNKIIFYSFFSFSFAFHAFLEKYNFTNDYMQN